MVQKIINWLTRATIWEGEADNLRDAVLRAVTNGISLDYADLARVDLTRTNLTGASFSGAYLADAKFAGAYLPRVDFTRAYLVGADFSDTYLADAIFAGADLTDTNFAGAHLARASLTRATNAPRIVCVGPIGSRGDYTTFGLRDGAIYVRTGCFRGTLAEFAAAVAHTHGNNEHARAYRAACAMAETILLAAVEEAKKAAS